MAKQLTVAFDFDGVLAQYSGWKGHTHYGPPVLGMRELLQSLRAQGHKIIIYTTRGNSEIAEWCRVHGFPYDYINRNPAIQGNNPGKPIADVYVDDRSIRFDPADLDVLENEILNFETWWKPPAIESDTLHDALIDQSMREKDNNRKHDKRKRD